MLQGSEATNRQSSCSGMIARTKSADCELSLEYRSMEVTLLWCFVYKLEPMGGFVFVSVLVLFVFNKRFLLFFHPSFFFSFPPFSSFTFLS